MIPVCDMLQEDKLLNLISDLMAESSPLVTYNKCVKSRYNKYMKTLNSSDVDMRRILEKVKSDGDIQSMAQILRFLPEWITRSNYFLQQYLNLKI